MLNVYSYLNGDDAGEEILRLHKLVFKAKSEPELTVQLCPRCKEHVSSASRLCERCGSPLDMDELILEASMAEIERLRVALALDHSSRRVLEEDMAAQAKMIAELREEMRRLARDLKSLKEA